MKSTEARRLGRISLANYFAAALMMPYDDFLGMAEGLRYEIVRREALEGGFLQQHVLRGTAADGTYAACGIGIASSSWPSRTT